MLFILTTFFSYLVGHHEIRILHINWERVLEFGDLREENTVATWFSSIIYLMTSCGLMLLGWGKSSEFTISALGRYTFQLAALGACLLSADEVGSVHEQIGSWLERALHVFQGTSIYGTGYLWVAPLAPILLTGFLVVIYFVEKITLTMSSNNTAPQQIRIALLVSLLCLPGVFVFEIAGGYFAYIRVGEGIYSCFEEACEVIGMYSLFVGTAITAKYYDL